MSELIDKIDIAMKNAKTVHFVGIGGISVSSLAMITKYNGFDVTGSDKTKSDITEKLEKSGIMITYGHYPENVHGASVLVHTAAVKRENPELAEALKLGIPTFTRAEYLGWLMKKSKTRIGVAGTHGKSTVTSMISSIYMTASKDPTIVCGANIPELGGTYRIGKGDGFIFEACEYCDSFLSFYPTVAVITNIEYDHPDYFKDMDALRSSFGRYISIADYAVMNADDTESVKLASTLKSRVVTFGINAEADFRGENIVYNSDGTSEFDVKKCGRLLGRVYINVPGVHNVYNALASFAVAYSEGIEIKSIISGLSAYHGIGRRFEFMGIAKNGAIVYNDYAHHPSEIRATITAARSMKKRLVCLFQPHTFSRTFSLFNDFISALGLADVVLVSDIYAARETNEWGVSSKSLAESIKNGVYTGNIEESAEYVKNNFGEGDLVLILGAGDIINAGKIILE